MTGVQTCALPIFKDDESEVAKLAIQHFGSIEKYTETMKHNLEHFSELMETQLTEEVEEIGKQSDILYPESVKLIVFICQSTIRLAKSRKCTLIMLNKPVLM